MEKMAFLFDLDGVIFDTEGQYPVLWNRIGADWLGDADFGKKIKGQTLVQIFGRHFPDNETARKDIQERLDRYEGEMSYEYVPGVEDFLRALAGNGIPRAIVTSSNRAKMEHVYRVHPEIRDMFTHIFTGEDFTRSKPAPDCYLLGMKTYGTAPEATFIFEDSFSGLQAAKDSGGNVIALATTNSREAVAPYAGLVIDDFKGLAPEAVMKNFCKDE